LSADDDFRNSYMSASLVTLDSNFLNIYFLGGKHNVLTGSDFVRYAASSGALAGCSILIVGNLSPAEALGIFPGSRVEVLTPSFGFYRRPDELAAIVTRIGRTDPDIAFIAVGAPQSERLAHRLRVDGRMRGSIVCCGAAFEFLTGGQTRAPTVLSRVGLEWLWRICTDPKRLLMRYLRDGTFILRNWRQFLALPKARILRFDRVRINFPRPDQAPILILALAFLLHR
jgi:N-acetylglucosaminyldiphosphoundecaprenol N-acetyl-beta-D-mannosaminyltransferase